MKQLRIANWTAKALAVALISYGTAQANNIAFYKTVFNTDFAVGGVGGMRGTGHGTIALSGISGMVTKAYLYWQGPTDSGDPRANATVLVNNQSVVGTQIGFSHNHFWGFVNSQAYRADVTALVPRAGIYSLDEFVKPGRIDVNGASLIVFFDDGNPDNNRDVVLFEGNDSNVSNPYDGPGWNVTLAGINYVSGTAAMQLHVSEGQTIQDDALKLNGATLVGPGPIFQGDSVPSPNNGPNNNGCLWDIKTLLVTSYLHPGSNTLSLTHTARNGYDALSIVLAIIDLPAGAAPRTQHLPSVECQPPVTMFSAGSATIRAQVRDPDGDAVTFNISINGVTAKSGTIPAGISINPTTCEVTHTFVPGNYNVLFTVSDGVATAHCATTVTVADGTPPTITCPGNMVRPTDPGQCSAGVSYSVAATDDQPGLTVVCAPPSGSVFTKGMTTVNCTATDAAGNKATCSFTVTVRDTEPPTITGGTNLIVNAQTGRCDAVVEYTVTAADNCPGVSLTCTPPPGSVFAVGTTAVRCVATDTSGNSANHSFNVTVVSTGGRLILNKVASKPTFLAGEPVTYIYEVSNPGCTVLSDITIKDDNGTPAFAGDDFVVASNITLAPQETKVFTKIIILPVTLVKNSCVTNLATITAKSGTQTLTASAQATVCAQLPCSTCELRYPFASSNPRTSVIFNESEILRGFSPNVAGPGDTIKVWYNDEHALVLGVRRVIVKTSTGTTTTDYPITPLAAVPSGARNPLVGSTALSGDQAGTDLSDRPLYPTLFVTDITNDPNSLAGDWQFGGTPILPHAIFGTWKGAVRVVDRRKSPAEVTVTPDADPAKNNWNLADGDPAPPGLVNQGYGAEVRWNVDDLGLIPGHTYRLYFMVHDGDQNKLGGDSGHGCATLCFTKPSPVNLRVTAMTSLSGGKREVIWSTEPGRTYRLQYKNNLSESSWHDLPGIITASGPTASLVDHSAGTASQRFYRVVLVP